MEQSSYTVGENIDHIMEAAASIGGTSRASVYSEDMKARQIKQFFMLVFLCSAVIHFCACSRPVQGSYVSILPDNVCTIFIKLRIDDSRSFKNIFARYLQLPVINPLNAELNPICHLPIY
jgi:hypothetical protein